jgi:hypothetical protein
MKGPQLLAILDNEEAAAEFAMFVPFWVALLAVCFVTPKNEPCKNKIFNIMQNYKTSAE